MKTLLIYSIICVYFASSVYSKEVIIGAKNFDENKILAKMLVLIFEKHNYNVNYKENILTKNIRKMIRSNGKEVDIYWEYTGTEFRARLQNFNEEQLKISRDSEKLFNEVQEEAQKEGIVWLSRSNINNSYTLVALPDIADEHRLKTISDLGGLLTKSPDFPIVTNEAFVVRGDGLWRMGEYYGFREPKNLQTYGHSAIIHLLINEKASIGMVYGTDPEILKYNWTVLEDDKKFLPVYNPAPIVKEEFYRDNLEIMKIIDTLGPQITHTKMISMIRDVKFENKSVETVARAFLRERDLL